jgi:hypothetical protein
MSVELHGVCCCLSDIAFPPLWINGHMAATKALGKPGLLEEFGKAANNSDASRTTVRWV